MVDIESPLVGGNKELRKQLLAVPHTDAGNGEAFEILHGRHRFRFDHDKRKWLVWNGRFWEQDRDDEADRAALLTARALLSVAATIDNDTARKVAAAWAHGSESVSRREAMLRSARSIRSLALTTPAFDRNPFLLTVANGTLNLRTGKLRDFRPADLITRASEVLYDPAAEAPRWLRFLDEVFLGDKDLIQFLQRAVGYSLTGNTEEQCLFILYGSGANGKTTFLETIIQLLGTHAVTTPFSTVIVQRNPGSPRNDLAALHGARLVKASEGEHQSVFAESTVKELTGSDVITARFLFKEHFSYRPTFKLWLSTNHAPEIRGTDYAIWRRIRLVPFAREFTEADRDLRLREKLEEELPGILAWAVRGCLEWQKQRLGLAHSVEVATRKYRQESDQIGRFLKDRCDLRAGNQTPAKQLYDDYVRWGGQQHEKPLATNQFAEKIAERGIGRKRGSGGVIYLGVGLVPALPLDAPAIPLPTGKGRGEGRGD